MTDLRAQIDAIDGALMALFAERAGYIARAAEIKAQIDLPARLPDRVNAVLSRIEQHAHAHDLDPAPYRAMWSILIEWAIAHEEELMSKDQSL